MMLRDACGLRPPKVVVLMSNAVNVEGMEAGRVLRLNPAVRRIIYLVVPAT